MRTMSVRATSCARRAAAYWAVRGMHSWSIAQRGSKIVRAHVWTWAEERTSKPPSESSFRPSWATPLPTHRLQGLATSHRPDATNVLRRRLHSSFAVKAMEGWKIENIVNLHEYALDDLDGERGAVLVRKVRVLMLHQTSCDGNLCRMRESANVNSW